MQTNCIISTSTSLVNRQIGGCLHIEPDKGYIEAQRLLEKEYGDLYKKSNAEAEALKLVNYQVQRPSIKALVLLPNQMQERNENQRTHGSSEPSTKHAVCCVEVASQFANEVAQKCSKKQTKRWKNC